VLLHVAHPGVDLLLRLVLGDAVALLDLADELGAAPLDGVEVVIGELAPLLLNAPAELLPIAFDAIPMEITPFADGPNGAAMVS
jgi:hypothetical protein